MTLAGVDATRRAKVLLQEKSPDPADYQDAYTGLQDRFRQSVALAEPFEELLLMDQRGQVIISTDATQESKIYATETFFQQGLTAPYVQKPLYSPSLHRTSIIVARPVTDEQGQILGVLAGRASMAQLSKIMHERAGLGETGETYLVGTNKALLTQPRSAETDVGYVRSEGTDAAIGNRVDGFGLYDGYNDVPVVGVYHWLPELEVALLAEQDSPRPFARPM